MEKFKFLLKDIRFWIFIFFIIRLIGITNPPLEVSHNWRQTTVTMVARNFLEIDNNIFYPRIDIAGEKTGITGMEFPILNYLIYLVSEVFGYEHWYGRLINLFISSLGLFYFYRLVKKYFEEQTAFFATIILLFSVWFAFSRKIMPDTFAMSFILMSVYYGTNFFDKKASFKNLGLYILFLGIGILSKLPVAYLIILFAVFYFQKDIKWKQKILFAISTIGILVPAIYWYFVWVPHLVETFGFWHFFMGKSLGQGFQEIAENINLTLKRFYETALKYSGFVVFLMGSFFVIKQRETKMMYVFMSTFLCFLIIVFKAGFTFYHHSYYIIPFAPIMALVAAYGLTQIKYQKIAYFLLIVVAVEGFGNQLHDIHIREDHQQLLSLDTDLDKFCKKTDLILVNSGKYPTPMYFTHRKGWIDYNENIQKENYFNELKTKGLTHVVILKRVFGTPITLNLQLLLDNENYVIYKVK